MVCNSFELSVRDLTRTVFEIFIFFVSRSSDEKIKTGIGGEALSKIGNKSNPDDSLGRLTSSMTRS